MKHVCVRSAPEGRPASDLSFRSATVDDVDAVVPLMYESSRALFDYSFGFSDGGGDVGGFLRHAFLRGGGYFGWRQQLVATCAGAVVGTLTLYRGRDYPRLSGETMRAVLGYFGVRRTAIVVWRMLSLAPLFITPGRDSLFVANVCVEASHRGRGISQQLMDYGIASLRAPELSIVELDVSFGNGRAQRLYERLGFVVVAERPYRGRRALDGFRRMQRPLG